MKLQRAHRSWLARWLVAALLCMQFSAVVHACPRVAPAAMAAMADMADCPGAAGHASPAPEQLGLCKAHCQQASTAVDNASAAHALEAPALVALYVAPLHADAALPLHDAVSPAAGAPPPAEPLATRPHVLRS